MCLWRVCKSIARLIADHRYLLSGMAWRLVTQVNATSVLVSARLVCVAVLAPNTLTYIVPSKFLALSRLLN